MKTGGGLKGQDFMPSTNQTLAFDSIDLRSAFNQE